MFKLNSVQVAGAPSLPTTPGEFGRSSVSWCLLLLISVSEFQLLISSANLNVSSTEFKLNSSGKLKSTHLLGGKILRSISVDDSAERTGRPCGRYRTRSVKYRSPGSDRPSSPRAFSACSPDTAGPILRSSLATRRSFGSHFCWRKDEICSLAEKFRRRN